MSELHQLTLQDASAALAAGELTSFALTEALLERIQRLEPMVRAFLTVSGEQALEAARAADASRSSSSGPLHGIPIGIKDVICTRGVTTTCGSAILEGFVPPYNATVVERLNAAGAISVGKLNCDEFAMGSSTENSAYQVTRNPWDYERVPGGSSGGSAAAVAAGMVPASLGTDTGGSIRQPAALCGVSGLKPTYGRVSRYGLIAYGSSLDQIGPLAWSVADLALMLEAIAGHDPRDGTSANLPVPNYRAALTGELRGLRVGVPREYFVAGIDPAVEAVTRTALEVLREQGAELVEVSLPHTKYALPTYYIIAPAEASANLARYDGVRYGPREPGAGMWESIETTRGRRFGAEVRRRIMLGTYALSAGYYDAYYRRAQQVRTLIKADFSQAFAHVDLLATPTSPTVAFKIGQKLDDPLAMYLSDICTLPINLAGVPGLVVPCGFSAGLPVGLQLIGPAFAEEHLLRVGDAYQRVTDWHKQRPVVA
ncbi:Asp-tRNA(Asn)/Glu-tRNA(Gln) amidotransferase subunit GatA [Candidatus Viridilinea mediisalina]|uniref:Glutamyl-tRNA(Gln) amidotransferase subunit A n=1 Tax=Candidatus Viridilinea mediisalina TaxID=2024553 RepID=A0A2A6RPF2_9CHLR|nr:Asp-tRNA(Asn)/Glu-tRNA(Gln) amidotransferase subunit GatA [Candidatus Viridilinea mediisalina]PDW04748.1 Asp-tRNA(Asn)/Glu-tRNA(Gln) amidotransferase GatCAB subunit A [Candidatus Viridilinea mediisalina]